MLSRTIILIGAMLYTLSACSKQDEQPTVSPQNQTSMEQPNNPNPPAEQPNASADEQALRATLDRHNKAMVDRDIATLGSLMADDLVLVHVTGRKQSKTEWLEDIRTEQMRYFSVQRENLKIQVNGNKAVMTFTSVLDARIYGSHYPNFRINATMYFEKRNNQWIRVNPF
ncbi:hypothetical protein RCZ04_06030 [Capnocytophaga sp. HP1101]